MIANYLFGNKDIWYAYYEHLYWDWNHTHYGLILPFDWLSAFQQTLILYNPPLNKMNDSMLVSYSGSIIYVSSALCHDDVLVFPTVERLNHLLEERKKEIENLSVEDSERVDR